MVKAVILLSVMMVSLVYCLPAEPQGYRLKYKVDYDDVLRHPEKLQAFFKCLMDTAPCDPPTAELKTILPEAMSTVCGKCSAEQKDRMFSAIKYLSEKEPKVWKGLETKYDKERALQKNSKTNPIMIKYKLNL